MTSFARAFALVVAALLALFARAALAQAPPVSITHTYSPYEEQTIHEVVDPLHATVDSAPEGKTIEAIDIVPLDVIEERDPAPRLLNIIHTRTKEYVVRREILERIGDPYKKVLIDETARNLRRLPQISLVVAVALAGSAPGRVKLLVITKDVWSLRLGTSIGYGKRGLESLLMEPTETNVFGAHQTVLARFTYDPGAYSLGAAYRVPRVQGHWLTFVADGNVYVNEKTGSPEGSFGSVSIQRPLYSALTEWAWFTGVGWRDHVQRRFVDAQLSTFRVQDASGAIRDTNIPDEYRARAITQQAEITRSFGWGTKNDFTAGAEVNRRLYHTIDDLSRFPAADVASYVQSLPVSDTRVGPYFQWRAYTSNFMRILDFETLGLQEDYRLGHDVWVRAYPVTTLLGSSRSFFGVFAAAQYTAAIRDGFLRVSVDSTTEAEVDRLSDAAIGANVRFVSPRLGFGRIVFDGAVLSRYRNYLNTVSFLGGSGRLRGFPSNGLRGKDLVAMNLEYRSRPIEILTCEIGAAAFWDVGDAFNGFDNLSLKQAVGFGLRGLFPQVNRIVLRGDVGFPVVIGNAQGVQPWTFFIAFEQAFPIESVGGTSASGGTSSSTGGALGQ